MLFRPQARPEVPPPPGPPPDPRRPARRCPGRSAPLPPQPAKGRRRGGGGGRPAGATAGWAALTFRFDRCPTPGRYKGAARGPGGGSGAQLPRRAHHGHPAPAAAAAAAAAAPGVGRAPRAPQVSPRPPGTHARPSDAPRPRPLAHRCARPAPETARGPAIPRPRRAPRHSDGTFTSELSRLRDSARLQRLLQGLVGKRR